jgi:molybdopterin-guanine dinucleotide biosynthesis protein A
MGEDKALVVLGGQTLVERALATLREAGLTAAIAGARSPLAGFAPVIEDAEPGRGPLGGICAAFSATTARRAVFLPVDLPLLPASLLRFLVEDASRTGCAVTLARVNGFTQTFPAVVDRAALPALVVELESGRGGCFAGFKAAAASLGERVRAIAVEQLVQSGHLAAPDRLPPARWYLNVNAIGDLCLAEAHLRAAIA